MKMKNLEDAERLMRKGIDLQKERGADDASISLGMRLSRLFYFYFLLI